MQNSSKKIKPLKWISEEYDISMSRLYKATFNKEFAYFKPNGSGKIYVDIDKDFMPWLTGHRIPSNTEIENQSRIPA